MTRDFHRPDLCATNHPFKERSRSAYSQKSRVKSTSTV